MNLRERVASFQAAWPKASSFGAAPVVFPTADGSERMYATWMGGADYKNKSAMYGCLEGSVRVLTADLRWVRQDSLEVGDELVGVTEEFGDIRNRRRLKRSRVMEIGPVRLPSMRLTFDDSTSIVCSLDHRWLIQGKRTDWQPSERLAIGSRVRRVVRPWAMPDPFDSGWIAGMLDGEGSLGFSGFRATISQNPGVTLDRVKSILTRWGVQFALSEKKGQINLDLRSTCSAEALKLLGMAPSVRHQHRWDGIGLPKSNAWATVTAIDLIGDVDLVGMTTSTKTFIAEGLVSHNSFPPYFTPRVFSLFPDAKQVLHLFSGSLTAGQVYSDWFEGTDRWLTARGDNATLAPIQIRFDSGLHPAALAAKPDVIGDAEALAGVLEMASDLTEPFDLIIADPPYAIKDQRLYWYEAMLALSDRGDGVSAHCAKCRLHSALHRPRYGKSTKEGRMVAKLGDFTHELVCPGYVRFKPLNKKKVLAECHKVLKPGGHLVWLDCSWAQFSKKMFRCVGMITILRSTGHRARIAQIYEKV